MDWKTYERHPLSLEYADIAGHDWREFLHNIRENGIVGYRIITLHDGKILDGWQLYRACLEIDLEPSFEVLPSHISPELFVATANDHRRHETPEQAMSRAAARRQRVAEARGKGESLRTIAGVEGVSVETVRTDLLETSGVKGLTPEPPDGKITGKDGKSYEAKAKILCPRCQRLGNPVSGCNGCRAARDGAKAARKVKSKARRTAVVSEPTEILDAFKTPIPKGLLAVWGDPWIQETIDFLAVFSEQFRLQRIGDGMRKRTKHYPFFIATDVVDGAGFVIQYLDDLIGHLKTNRPAGVCPRCGGKKCVECRSSGLVPREAYKALKGGK